MSEISLWGEVQDFGFCYESAGDNARRHWRKNALCEQIILFWKDILIYKSKDNPWLWQQSGSPWCHKESPYSHLFTWKGGSARIFWTVSTIWRGRICPRSGTRTCLKEWKRCLVNIDVWGAREIEVIGENGGRCRLEIVAHSCSENCVDWRLMSKGEIWTLMWSWVDCRFVLVGWLFVCLCLLTRHRQGANSTQVVSHFISSQSNAKHKLLAHCSKQPNCEICKRTRTTRVGCRRNSKISCPARSSSVISKQRTTRSSTEKKENRGTAQGVQLWYKSGPLENKRFTRA